MNTVQSRELFGNIPVHRAYLEADWLGRQIIWLAIPNNSDRVVDGLGFLAFRVGSIFFCSAPPLFEVVSWGSAFANTLSAFCSNRAIIRFDVHNKFNRLITDYVKLLAVEEMWQLIFSATSCETPERAKLLLSLHEPFDLSKDVIAAYLSEPNIDQIEDFEEVWFDEFFVILNPFIDHLERYIEMEENASFATRISRDAFGFAVQVEEIIRLLKGENPVVSRAILWPLGSSLTDDLTISKERFLSLFEKCTPSHLKTTYPELHDLINEKVKKECENCSGYALLLAAHSLIRPYCKLDGSRLNVENVNQHSDDFLAYLYLLVYSDESDALFDVAGCSKVLLPQEKSCSLLEFIEALKACSAIEVLFRLTPLTQSKYHLTLINLQKALLENYDVYLEAVRGNGQLPELLEEWVQVCNFTRPTPPNSPGKEWEIL